MKKIEKWVIEEKAKKAACKKALRIAVTVLTPLSILMSIMVVFARVPSVLACALLSIVGLIILFMSYDIYYEKYRKMFSEEAE